MDRRENGFSGGNVVQVLSGNSGSDHGTWNGEAADSYSNMIYEGRQSQSLSISDPPNKRSRNSQAGDSTSSSRSRVIGKMFYKTKLCSKFRAGTCPYITNCNFAHSIEELQKPPPNWQEIVAGNDDERPVLSENREEFQIPILGISDEAQRSYKGRYCKRFYTEEGCPYGENCTYLHDEQSKTRESVAISLGPGIIGGGGYGSNTNGSNLKPSNWKTRICNKWELTGYCPFGSKCHFAHGSSELHNYGGVVETEGIDFAAPDAKHENGHAKTSVDTAVALITTVPHSDVYQIGVQSHKTGHRSTEKWKGPDKISKIYGDWFDDL